MNRAKNITVDDVFREKELKIRRRFYNIVAGVVILFAFALVVTDVVIMKKEKVVEEVEVEKKVKVVEKVEVPKEYILLNNKNLITFKIKEKEFKKTFGKIKTMLKGAPDSELNKDIIILSVDEYKIGNIVSIKDLLKGKIEKKL